MYKKILIRIVIIFVVVILGIGLYCSIKKQLKEHTVPVEKITLAGYVGEAGALVYVA